MQEMNKETANELAELKKTTSNLMFDIDQFGFKVRSAEQDFIVSSIIGILSDFHIPVNRVKSIMDDVLLKCGRNPVVSFTYEETNLIKKELESKRNHMDLLQKSLHQNEDVVNLISINNGNG